MESVRFDDAAAPVVSSTDEADTAAELSASKIGTMASFGQQLDGRCF